MVFAQGIIKRKQFLVKEKIIMATLQEILATGGDVAAATRSFVEASAKFFDELAKNNLSLDFGAADTTSNVIDYDKPTTDSYVKSYKPISATDIILANKKMQSALAGEHFVDGFLACLALVMLAAG